MNVCKRLWIIYFFFSLISLSSRYFNFNKSSFLLYALFTHSRDVEPFYTLIFPFFTQCVIAWWSTKQARSEQLISWSGGKCQHFVEMCHVKSYNSKLITNWMKFFVKHCRLATQCFYQFDFRLVINRIWRINWFKFIRLDVHSEESRVMSQQQERGGSSVYDGTQLFILWSCLRQFFDL